jgi:hypothetical protein
MVLKTLPSYQLAHMRRPTVDPNHLLVDVVGPFFDTETAVPPQWGNPSVYGDNSFLNHPLSLANPTQVVLNRMWGYGAGRAQFVTDIRNATRNRPGVISELRFWGVTLELALELPSNLLNDPYQIPRVFGMTDPSSQTLRNLTPLFADGLKISFYRCSLFPVTFTLNQYAQRVMEYFAFLWNADVVNGFDWEVGFPPG